MVSLDEYGFRASMGWVELLEHSRVVLLVEAGSGKSDEMLAQSRRLVREVLSAFFIPLESLEDGFHYSLESIADQNRFDAWKEDGERLAWFFLDAVDELKLTGGKLDRALRQLSRALSGHFDRAGLSFRAAPAIGDRITTWAP